MMVPNVGKPAVPDHDIAFHAEDVVEIFFVMSQKGFFRNMGLVLVYSRGF